MFDLGPDTMIRTMQCSIEIRAQGLLSCRVEVADSLTRQLTLKASGTLFNQNIAEYKALVS